MVEVPGFEYTAYLRWHGIQERSADLALVEAGHGFEQERRILGRQDPLDDERQRARALVERIRREGTPGLVTYITAGDPDLGAGGASVIGSEWCTNTACPSNHAVPGLWRVGVNDYTCKVCGVRLRTPMDEVVAHRRMH